MFTIVLFLAEETKVSAFWRLNLAFYVVEVSQEKAWSFAL